MSIIDLNRYQRNYPLTRLQPIYATIANGDCCDDVEQLKNDFNDFQEDFGKLTDAFHYGLFKQDPIKNDVFYPELINYAGHTGPFFIELNTIPSQQLMPYNEDINFNEQHLFFNNSKKDIVFKDGKYFYGDRHWQINYTTYDITFTGVFPGDLY